MSGELSEGGAAMLLSCCAGAARDGTADVSAISRPVGKEESASGVLSGRVAPLAKVQVIPRLTTRGMDNKFAADEGTYSTSVRLISPLLLPQTVQRRTVPLPSAFARSLLPKVMERCPCPVVVSC